MTEPKCGCALLRDEERLVDILAQLRRGDLSGDQVQLRYDFATLSQDPDLFPHLKEPLRGRALTTLEWVREDIATLIMHHPAWA
ncbi:hypothetical protein A3E39_00330 [Candidatus Uhrbacteria bacterium RIFCSPHIGHO2_12_FULL_60_25]|uniref:Uncharacterized protein n=1 Tax=Candidatus Uhrbacteria bacterium RIFCSPHIGHO2_12_FULL_60_25 TaxID=1802399 RepID=A0A1F7ULT9_9BACT|nr:MAG: hypothetical protein A3D73_03020 [Candidatus Uhrbacteria bacterium RIFCSPHIGHO2_02_FULL_60_44]OGL79215.1 MAG: hypothetical protein A3E39_00330 [Candidatus Uhrbacteria bacterium RIFCSPHIGHO2_12_FULL_60_25]